MTTDVKLAGEAGPSTDEAVFAAMEPHEPGQFATHATPLIRNCWYVAALSDEVGRTPLARKLLGVDVVLYRTEGGEPVAMRNRCPHRSFPLARGKLVGDRLICGYHGMEFEPDGVCAHMPALSSTPSTVTVRTFPTADRGPLTWIWMGSPDLADEGLIPDTSWLADPGRSPTLIAGGAVIIVDDIVTSGATLTDAARALEEAGAALLGAATVAATARRVPVRQHTS